MSVPSLPMPETQSRDRRQRLECVELPHDTGRPPRSLRPCQPTPLPKAQGRTQAGTTIPWLMVGKAVPGHWKQTAQEQSERRETIGPGGPAEFSAVGAPGGGAREAGAEGRTPGELCSGKTAPLFLRTCPLCWPSLGNPRPGFLTWLGTQPLEPCPFWLGLFRLQGLPWRTPWDNVSAERPRETLWDICGTFPMGVAGREGTEEGRQVCDSEAALACPSLPHQFWKRGQTGRFSLENKVSRLQA